MPTMGENRHKTGPQRLEKLTYYRHGISKNQQSNMCNAEGLAFFMLCVARTDAIKNYCNFIFEAVR